MAPESQQISRWSFNRVWISKSSPAKMEILKHEIADEFHKISEEECRICLRKPTEICELFRNGREIPEKLMAVASVQVEEGDGLPGIICLPCNRLLDVSYDFKKQIQTSDEKLRQLLKLKSQKDNFSSANIVKAIIADVISSVINSVSSVKEKPMDTDRVKQEPSVENNENDHLNFSGAEEINPIDKSWFERIQTAKIDDEEAPLSWRTGRQRCSQCIKSFRTKVALQRHMIVHKRKPTLRYVCHICDKQLSSISKLKNHIAISHETTRKEPEEKIDVREKRVSARGTQKTRKCFETPKSQKKNFKFKCNVCSKQFTYQKSFVTHAKSHENETSNPEKETRQRIEDEEDRDEDAEDGAEEDDEEDDDGNLPAKNLQCTQCGKLFATKRNLKRHISTHSGLKYNCTTCGKGFSRVDKLRDHEQSKHKLELFENSDSEDRDDSESANKTGNFPEAKKKDRHNRPYQCSLCPKSFAQAQSLANHNERHKRVKETQKRFLCEVCSKCFAQSGSLVAHMRTHTGVKPYVCNVCSRAFTKSTYLQLHLRTHSGEKPYICQYCSRAFARANTLARHITMHTGEAKYHCQICTKSFRRLTSLNEHTYTHTGQRPYACKICAKRYNNAGSLYAHRKKCKAQQLSSSGFTVETSSQQQDTNEPEVLIYSERKSIEEPEVEQANQAPQYMIASVHNQKNAQANIIQPFTVEDQNVYSINSKQLKNPYYTIYPNM